MDAYAILFNDEMVRAINAELVAALDGLRHADGCWCDAAFAMPDTVVSHSAECISAQAAIAKMEGKE